MEKTDYRFKFLYVIGIISVIFGHCGQGISLFYDWFPPYSFHVQLFVFCSGYFYKKTSEENILKFFLHKIKTIIVPLYLWNLFYGIFGACTRSLGLSIAGRLTWYNLLIAPIKNGHQFTYNCGGWFVIPLFMVQIFIILVRKILSVIRIEVSEYIIFICSLTLGIVGVCLSNKGYNQNWGLVLTRFLCTVPFYEAGILYKEKLERKDKISNMVYFSFVFVAQLIIITINSGNITYSLAWCTLFPENILLTYIVPYLAIAFWLRISTIVLPLIQNNKLIKLIGDNTYTIMINHYMGFMFIKTIFALLYKYTKFCANFNLSEYKANIGYFYYPQDMVHWGIIYCIAGVVVPIMMQLCVNKVKGRLLNKMKVMVYNE